MGETIISAAGTRTVVTRGFEAIADAIMYRWRIERDTWVSPTEIEHTRAYLLAVGITTTALPDGRFAIEGEDTRAYDPAPLVMVGLRHLHAARRGTRKF
jgi:hypothetical protein